MMVADYLMPKQKPPILTVGKQYDIEGTFSINTPTGFGDSEGLLVFGKMKDRQGADRFSMRGLDRCRGEWRLDAAVHNLRKLHRESVRRSKMPADRRHAARGRANQAA